MLTKAQSIRISFHLCSRNRCHFLIDGENVGTESLIPAPRVTELLSGGDSGESGPPSALHSPFPPPVPLCRRNTVVSSFSGMLRK